MKSLIPCLVISVLVGSLFAANADPQPRSPADRNPAAGSEVDYALNLRDPFSPVGYRPPMSEGWRPAADASAVSNVPPPSIDLMARAKDLLRVSGIVKRGNTYVANVNGTIVKAGDEVGVTVDGHTIVFLIRAISMQRIEIEPRK
ncbi:MAG: hypothetical protein PHW60_09760 [Kiritimatiellae bacterium]|nr:hypothetical protein [Kiritimatiellia bacterium]